MLTSQQTYKYTHSCCHHLYIFAYGLLHFVLQQSAWWILFILKPFSWCFFLSFSLWKSTSSSSLSAMKSCYFSFHILFHYFFRMLEWWLLYSHFAYGRVFRSYFFFLNHFGFLVWVSERHFKLFTDLTHSLELYHLNNVKLTAYNHIESDTTIHKHI